MDSRSCVAASPHCTAAPPARYPAWLPAVIIVAVLAAVTFARGTTDPCDPACSSSLPVPERAL